MRSKNSKDIFLGYLVLPPLLSFCVTAPKRLCQLNSNLVETTLPKPLNGLSWYFVGMFLRILSRQLLPNGWMDWAEILWVCFLGYLIFPYLLSFCVSAPKRLCQLSSNLLIAIPHKPLNRLSWNFVSMFLRITYCVLITNFLRNCS